MTEGARHWSLRLRLMKYMFIASLATMAIGVIAVYVAARAEERTLRDARLADLARTILAFTAHEITEISQKGRTDRMHTETAETLGGRYRYQVWSQRGELLLHSAHAPSASPMMQAGGPSYATVEMSDQRFRVVSLPSADGLMTIQVAELEDQAHSAVASLGPYVLLLLALPFAIIIGLMWLTLAGPLLAINQSAAQLRRRGPADLRPLHVIDPPLELEPMISAINALFQRVGQAMSIEKGFTAMAAHELRTPLAGLRAQAQLATIATTPSDRESSLSAVMEGVDRASHLVQQLLDLARTEGLEHVGRSDLQLVDLHVLCNGVLSDLLRQRKTPAATVRLELDAKSMLAMGSGLLLLLRNLLDNALKYTPANGRIKVSAERGRGSVTLCIDDSGSGIEAALRGKVFDRFERLGRTGADGVGLGMVIVLAVVKAHGASIKLLDSPLGGLRVRVEFPQPGEQEEG